MMFRSLIFISILFVSCRVSKNYKTEDVLELKKDKNGTIFYKKIGKLYKTSHGDEYVISYQEFDSLGRRIRKYGFKNRNTNSKYLKYDTSQMDKHLVISHYVGNHPYLEETYVCPLNVDIHIIPSIQYLQRQVYTPDSMQTANGNISIFISDHRDSIAVGEYRKAKIVKPFLAEYSEWFIFEIPISKMQFDSSGILSLRDAKKTFVFN